MTRRGGGDAGQVGGIEAIPFGLLVFVAGALLVLNAWGVVDARFATDAAAHQAARAFVEADPVGSAEAAARAAGAAALAGHGRDPDRAELELQADRVARCRRVVAVVRYRVPALALPFLGGFGDGIEVRSRASELIDPFRADVPGSAEGCP